MQEIDEKSKKYTEAHAHLMDIHLQIVIRLHVFIELAEKLDVDDYATAMKMGLAHANSEKSNNRSGSTN